MFYSQQLPCGKLEADYCFCAAVVVNRVVVRHATHLCRRSVDKGARIGVHQLVPPAVLTKPVFLYAFTFVRSMRKSR